MNQLHVSLQARKRATRKTGQKRGVAMNRKTCWSLFAVICLIGLSSCSSGNSGSNNNNNNDTTPVMAIAATSGGSQSAEVGGAFTAPLVATVTTNGSPTSGVTVTFTAPSTGASGAFANQTATETATTGANGTASSTLTANATTGGPYTVTATVSGVATPANFSLTNTAMPPVEAIAATSGGSQSAVVGVAFTAPLVATVTTNGSPTSGVAVTFTAPSTGASGTFANQTTTETVTTGANGLATSTLTANATTGGPYTVTATVSGVATPATFSLTNTAMPPPPVVAITPTSGVSQSAVVAGAFAAPLVATVTTNGLPASGVAVTFTAPSTGASGTFANQAATETDTTGANGVVTSTTFTANTTGGGPYTVTATVSGVATAATYSLTNTTTLYSFYLTGLEGSNGVPKFYALAGSVNIDAVGNVLGGEQDYNDGRGFTSPEPQGDTISGGTLAVNASTGQGTLTLNTSNTNFGVQGVETLGVQFVNNNHALIIQFDGSATSSGTLDLQTLPSTLSGGYAFTLSGVQSSPAPVVFGGVFSVSGTSLQNGIADEDDAGVVTTETPFTGTISAADAFGRGTITGAGIATTLNYYTVGPEAIRIIDVDAADSGVGSAFGQGTTTFSNTSLGTSVFGIESNSSTTNTLFGVLGMFTTTPAGGTFQGVADNDENGTVIEAASPIGGTYSISPTINGVTYNGYGSLTIAPGDLGDVNVLGIYLTDPNLNLNDPNNTTSGFGGALVTDLDFLLGGTGVLVPQTDNAPADFAGNYDFGGQEYNADPLWEFDFVGQGSVTGGVLNGTGLVSDPGSYFSSTLTDTGVTFSGTATPDPVNVGRFTIPLAVTVTGVPAVNLSVVIYQASGGQLFWLDEDPFSVFLGPLEQQGQLTGLAAMKRAAIAKLKRK
jgi:hypothetical protein